jgi:hypothetical protein
MKHAVQMGSVAMIYIPSFIEVNVGGYAQTQRQDGDLTRLLQESMVKIENV